MKQIIPVIINYLLISFCLTMKTFSQDPGAINKDVKPVLISKQFTFTEGPAVDRYGNIFFTDQPNNKIWKFDVRGKLSVFMDSSGRSNGMYFDSKGNLVTCADEKNQLWSIDPKGKVTVLLNDFHGQRFNGPNDLWIDHKDGIYFTDPYFERDYWHRKGPQPEIKDEILYYLPKGKTMPIVVDADLKKPNGIVGTNDRHLFVSDMGVGKIFKYYIADDGTLKNRSVFVADVADGMTIDNKGNLYLAGRGVTVYNSHGKKIRHFDIPAAWTANLCFGGLKRDILFITASESIYKMRMKVTGIR